LIQQYAGWFGIRESFDVSRKASIMRVIERCCTTHLSHLAVQAAGAVVCLLPLARRSAWSHPQFRLRLLCSLLIAAVIFNDSAEPPTYIIAVTGAAIWYAAKPTRSTTDHLLIGTVLVLTSLASTDAYPRYLRARIAGPYTLKPLGCLAVWLKMNIELLIEDFSSPASLGVDGGRVPDS
jgi:hypothetical protein